ncbi:MAG: hypothetical protein IKW00_01330 [Clostridia bacterium]|nr:hypothetical protein [Clostridia bacterium]
MYTHNAMKKIRNLLVMLLVLLAVFAMSAFAAEDVNFTISVEPSSLTKPGDVTVSIRVVNAGDKDMTEPVVLYDPDGNIVAGFGDGGQALIKKGEYVSAQDTYAVTQKQLDEGKLTYSVSYNEVGKDGAVTVKTQTASAQLTFTGTRTELTVNRTIDPEVVRNGNLVSVTYELYNAGNVEITNIRVREDSSVSRSPQTVKSLAPGARQTVKFTATMGNNDLKSAGVVTYKAGSESFEEKLPEAVIARAKPGLVLDNILTADKTAISTGETVTLKLSIANNGNITYSNITVTDPAYGEIFTNLTLGPGETLVREKQFTLSKTTSFKYSITLPDNTGVTNTVSSNELKISVYDPSQVMHISVTAQADTATIARIPADVKFALTVTNNSTMEAKNVSLYHGDTFIYTIDKLAPSKSVTIERDFTVSQAGKFRFTAKTKDALDNTVAFDSNEIVLTYAAPTVAPTAEPIITPAPLVTATVAPIEVLDPVTVKTNEVLKYAAMALCGLFGLTFIFFVVTTIARGKRRAASKKAYDHMELGAKRDYREPARRDRKEQPETIEEEFDVKKAVESSRPSDEVLREELEAEKVQAETAPVEHQADENGGYHLTREVPAAPAEAPAEEEAPRKRNRRADRNKANEDE